MSEQDAKTAASWLNGGSAIANIVGTFIPSGPARIVVTTVEKLLELGAGFALLFGSDAPIHITRIVAITKGDRDKVHDRLAQYLRDAIAGKS